MHICQMLILAIEIITWTQRQKPLFNVQHLLACSTIMHDEIIAYMKKLAPNLKHFMPGIIAYDKFIS